MDDKNYTREDVSANEVLLSMELPADALLHSYNQLLTERGESMNIKGFRKGKVPTDMIEPQLETLLMAETFEQLAPYYVNAAIIKEELQPIAPPEYSDLDNIVKGKPVKFKVKVTLMPEFTLGDLGSIKIDETNIDVTDEEIENTLKTMFSNNQSTPDKEDQKEMDDAWAKEIAKTYQFSDVNNLKDLKEKIRELLARQKQNLVDQNRASDVIRSAVEVSKIEIPEAAIGFEAQQREEAFHNDLEGMNVTMEDFLKERGATMEDLKAMWQKDAKEAIENDVLLKLYAEKHELKLDDKELAAEIEVIKQSAKQNYEMEHAGHDHESNFDESVYDDPQWQEQIKGYLLKQKAYQELLKDVLGEDILNEQSPKEAKNAEEKSEKKSKSKAKKKSPDTKKSTKKKSEKK